MKVPKSLWWAIGLFFLGSFFVFQTGDDVGMTNDAPGWIIYPSMQEGEWINQLLHGHFDILRNKAYTDRCWTVPIKEFPDQTQPPVARIWFWWGWKLFGNSLGLIDGYRLGAATVTGLFLAILLPWLARLYGWGSAAATGLMILLSPRIFTNLQYLSWDMPVTVFIVLGTIAFYRGVTKNRWVLFFVLFGLSLATKLNGLFFPIPLIVWGAWYAWRNKDLKCPNALVFILMGGAISGGVLLLSWPDLWKNPIYRLAAYLYQFTSPRGACLYLGQYFGAQSAFDFIRYATPWHYPFVILLTSTPIPVLLCLAAGIAVAFRDRKTDPIPTVFAFSGLFWLLLLAQAGGFAGERSMLTGIVFLTIVAGIGFAAIVKWASLAVTKLFRRTTSPATVTTVALLAAVILSLGSSLASVYPHGLVYFNGVLGGTKGALEKYGMESAYWTTYLNSSLWKFINKEIETSHAPKRMTLLGMVTGSPSIYQEDRKLAPKEQFQIISMHAPASHLDNPQELLAADYYAICTYEELESYGYRQPELTEMIAANAEPAFSITPGGTPIFSLYRRDDMFNRMLAVDAQPGKFKTGIDHVVGGVSLIGCGQNLSSNTIATGGKVFADLLFQTRNDSTVTPLRLSFLADGKPVVMDDPERTHRIKRFDNTIKLNPDFGQPVRHEYDVLVYPNLSRSFDPFAALGTNRTYQLRVPVKIPTTLSPGTYELVLTDPANSHTSDIPVASLGSIRVEQDSSPNARSRILLSALVFVLLIPTLWYLDRRTTGVAAA